MKARTFFLASLAVILVCFGALIALLSMEDPFFVLGGIEEGETALFDNQRYEMPGLIRHQDYSAVVMGTSLVANYRASWFTEGLGKETLKITFPDGWISEFDTALNLAFRTHPDLSTVLFCLDPNILIRSDSERTVELPGYLYNLNPLDDLEYLLNADTYVLVLDAMLARRSERVTLDEAYIWDGKYKFSWTSALEGYPRPERVSEPLPADAYLEAARANLDIVCSWIEEHPDTLFKIWFPPYSILYWDKAQREGTTEAILTALEYASDRLTSHENVNLYSFLNDQWTVTNLEQYTDHIHCSSEVTKQTAQCIINGDWRVWHGICKAHVDSLRQFVNSYDYDRLFPWQTEPEQSP